MTDGSAAIPDFPMTRDFRALHDAVFTVLPTEDGPEAAEYDQRRSRFLGYAFPARSADQVADVVLRIRRGHDGARHVVHAAVLAGDGTGSILTPHIGGSTLEAQESIGHFVSQRLEDYWFRASTTLSVNLPQMTLHQGKGAARIAHLHDNLPGVLARVNKVLGEENINISAQSLATEGELGYVVTDVATRPTPAALDALRHLPGTIRMRIIEL